MRTTIGTCSRSSVTPSLALRQGNKDVKRSRFVTVGLYIVEASTADRCELANVGVTPPLFCYI